MAEIQEQGGLLRGQTEEMLVVVVDDLHQICKQPVFFVGRNGRLWGGKAVRPGWCLRSHTGVEAGGNFHHHEADQGHRDQQGAGVGHVSSP
jgi:hypothetical protein